MDSRELLAFLHSRARDAVSLYDDVIPARDAGIQSISSQTLFLTYTPTIFCLLHDLLYMDPSGLCCIATYERLTIQATY